MDLATGAIGSIISKLAELLKEEYKLQAGVKEQVGPLTHELEYVYAFLQKIDKVPLDQLDEQVKVWASEVRDASYDMEDILDAFLVRVKGPKPIKKNKLERLQEKMSSLFSKTKARHGIADAIDKVNKKLKDIAERRSRYKLDDHVVSPASLSTSVDPRIALVHKTTASMLIGIDEPKEAVIKRLSHDDLSSTNKTKVVSIHGFGGVGKTTLAKATYDELKHKYKFGAFVSVGRNPDFVKVFKDILFDLDNVKFKSIHSTQRGVDFLIRELLQFLGEERYLIVIDDVWETQSRKTILGPLTGNAIGSRVIITTRNSEVATGDVYKLQPLSYDNSKKLFYARIFGGEDKCPDNQRQEVSEVAHKILSKCAGVPLAIITMASSLVGKSMPEWFEVCNRIGFRDKDKEQLGDTMWILSLSYYDLPSHLKTCLLYLSLFPEDYLIEKDGLIWMWIAEGFVNGDPEVGLFEIGEQYFNDLINRSLIQPVENEDTGIVDGCRVHDIILDLIRHLSSEANFAIVFDNVKAGTLSGSNARRLAVHQSRVVEDVPQDNDRDKARARSFIGFRCSFGSQVMLWSFKLLRVLHLVGCDDVHLDGHVGDLIHLRYLGVRNQSGTLKLPEEIGALKFLRVLDLRGSTISNGLPLSVGMLTQLVCLRASARDFKFPGGIIKNLTSLQELRIYSRGDYFVQFVKELGNLRELRVLCTSLYGIYDERMQLDFWRSLGNLDKLQCLKLSSYDYEPSLHGGWWKNEELLPRGLRQLFIDNLYPHSQLPSCIDPLHLPNLSHLSLTLRDPSDLQLKVLGGLPQLCYLELTTWGRGSAKLTGTTTHGYFPRLRSLRLPVSTAWFVVNEEDSSVSVTIGRNPPPSFGSKKKQDNWQVVPIIMPILESLHFRGFVKNGSCDNLGLEWLASLQKVSVELDCLDDHVDALEKEEAALRHAIQVHPNRPTLEIEILRI